MATRVTEAEALGDITPGERAADVTARYRDVGGTLVNQIGPGQLDNPRIAAREAQYGNRQAEIESVMAMDEAAFDRVRAVEQNMVGRAENLIEDVMRKGSETVRPGLIDSTEELVTGLNDLVTALERGTPVGVLADKFRALQNEAFAIVLPKIVRAQLAIEGTHLPNMEDPYGRAQDTIAIMPTSSFRPIVPKRR